MKTLKQIIEGTVVMSDYKLDKSGRKYKAHRMKMKDSEDVTEAKQEPSAVKDGKLQGHMVNFKPKGKLSGDEVVKKVKEIAKSLQSTHPDKVHKGAYSHGYGDYSFNDKHRGPKSGYVVVKSKEHLDAVKKHIKAHGASIQEDVEQVDEISKPLVKKYLSKAVDNFGHQNMMRRNTVDSEEKKDAARREKSRQTGISRAMAREEYLNPYYEILEAAHQVEDPDNVARKNILAKIIKRATPKNGEVMTTMTDAGGSLAEARGRPRKNPMPQKSDDDEGDDYGPDSGVEADQHIHVQLKKASDSKDRPFEMTFKNGKKKAVPHKVASDLLHATEKLKPEHRKMVHDEMHKSHENLMSFHKMVTNN